MAFNAFGLITVFEEKKVSTLTAFPKRKELLITGQVLRECNSSNLL
ncbi:uncharacterized protein G2W53_000972 [Senna tora]|uniref:Uncharacterized protein n=1 Tax=Senna tora TaxID=362788 RepID=A0A835CM55_9FABA|nr:uncharacterized protein G2W53_000972 [Senna tora]